MSELLNTKELAGKLGRNKNYIYTMRARGFKMPGGLATIEAAYSWLSKHKAPYSQKWSCKR